jgi:hypothetical protein
MRSSDAPAYVPAYPMAARPLCPHEREHAIPPVLSNARTTKNERTKRGCRAHT